MTTTSTTAVGSAPAPAGLLARFAGIITSPKATFQGIAAHPRWFWMLVVTTLITLVCTAGPMFTEWGRQAALDQQVRMMESFGQTINDDAYAAMERGMAFAAYTSAIGIAIFAPLMLLIVSGIFYAVFNAALGGNATFKQLVSVVVHAGVIGALAQLFALPMNYARGAMSSSTNLAVLLPMLDESSFLAGFLGAIDLFMVWYCLVLAIGLAVLYKRRTQPIAIGLFVVYAVIAIAIGLVKSAFGGSN